MPTASSWRWTSSLPHPLLPPSSPSSTSNNRLVGCRAASDPMASSHGNSKAKKKVVVVGSGWAGLAAAHHLSKQGLGVTVLETACSAEVGVNVIDFDNTDVSWRKYDSMTARELFKDYGCSEKLYREVLKPIVQVGLFAAPEQCSAAATLGMLYYFILAHQQDLDVVWCRGKVDEKIFRPWLEVIKSNNGLFIDEKMVADFSIDEDTGSISEVVCGKEKYPADAVVLAVGVSTLHNIIQSSPVLQTRQEFLNVMHLAAIDVVSVKLWLDKKVKIPNANNIFIGFEDSMGCTFFNLNAIYDEYKDESVTIIAAVFHRASQLLPLKDDQIVAKTMSYLSKCIEELQNCTTQEYEVTRSPKSVTHFFPGSYKYMMRVSTSFPNLFMAGDWIINRHGSWLQEKACVTGLEAANRVIDILEEGSFAKIIPVEEDEPHIQALRALNRSVNELKTQIPLSDYFL